MEMKFIEEEAIRFGLGEALLYSYFRTKIIHDLDQDRIYKKGAITTLFTFDELYQKLSYMPRERIDVFIKNIIERQKSPDGMNPVINLYEANDIMPYAFLLEFEIDPYNQYIILCNENDKILYGRYTPQYVAMTKIEYSNLEEEYGTEFIDDVIDEMNDYCAAHNKNYHHYPAAIRNWIRKKDEWYRREHNAKEIMQSQRTGPG